MTLEDCPRLPKLKCSYDSCYRKIILEIANRSEEGTAKRFMQRFPYKALCGWIIKGITCMQPSTHRGNPKQNLLPRNLLTIELKHRGTFETIRIWELLTMLYWYGVALYGQIFLIMFRQLFLVIFHQIYF